MGVDEMKEAIEKGYLSGKLDNPITIKFNDAVLLRVSAICDATGEEKAEWIRSLIIRELLKQEEQYNRMAQVWGKTKETMSNIGNQQKSPSADTDELSVQ